MMSWGRGIWSWVGRSIWGGVDGGIRGRVDYSMRTSGPDNCSGDDEKTCNLENNNFSPDLYTNICISFFTLKRECDWCTIFLN